MSSRDDRHRRTAARLHVTVLSLAAEVRARGGSLDWYDLTHAERQAAEAKAKTFWRDRMRDIRLKVTNNAGRSSRVGRPPSTGP